MLFLHRIKSGIVENPRKNTKTNKPLPLCLWPLPFPFPFAFFTLFFFSHTQFLLTSFAPCPCRSPLLCNFAHYQPIPGISSTGKKRADSKNSNSRVEPRPLKQKKQSYRRRSALIYHGSEKRPSVVEIGHAASFRIPEKKRGDRNINSKSRTTPLLPPPKEKPCVSVDASSKARTPC
ncbi:hypothetical protein F4802DRAFT_175844 [Xylaria palmicola]|nr:hypothetical protein F4802DRAFT_175844 [Xylaria palmicola]